MNSSRLLGASLLSALALAIIPATAAGASGSAVPSEPAATSVEVPVTLAQTDRGNDTFYPTVQIQLGTGSDPFTVVLDTGSTALVMWGDVEGATTTAAAAEVTYVGFSVDGAIATADFSIAGQTASAVNYLQGTCTGCTMGGVAVDGILGIGQDLQYPKATSGGTTTEYPWFSPFFQFDDTSLSEGYTISFETSGGQATSGSLTLGEPAITGETEGVAVIQASTAGGSYPTTLGYPVYQKAVPLCWTVEEQKPLCQATTIDTGAPSGIATGPQFDGYLEASSSGDGSSSPTPAPTAPGTRIGTLATGTALKFSTSASATPFASWTASQGAHTMGVDDSIADGHLNTGSAFFLDRTVGYDASAGQILVQNSGSVPPAPAAVTAAPTASGGELSVLWSDAASLLTAQVAASGAVEAPSRHLVRVRDAAGAVVVRLTVPGAQTSTTVTGLVGGASYTVEVAAENRFGIGEVARSAAAVPLAASGSDGMADAAAVGSGRLADTGASLALPLGVVLALLAAGAVTALVRRRSLASRRG